MNLLKESDVDGSWDYTCPEEGKWLHDQSGGVEKTVINKHVPSSEWDNI